MAYDWVVLPSDSKDKIHGAVEKEVGKKKNYDSGSFKRDAIEKAEEEVYLKNKEISDNLITLRNNYNHYKDRRDAQKTICDNLKSVLDKEDVKYKTAIDSVEKLKGQQEEYIKEIFLQKGHLENRLLNEPVGEVVTATLYSTGWNKKKSDLETQADAAAAETAVETLMTYIESFSTQKEGILSNDVITSHKSGRADAVKKILEHKIAAGKYLRIKSFRIYPLKETVHRSKMDSMNSSCETTTVLNESMLHDFLKKNNIELPENFKKRIRLKVTDSQTTTENDQKNTHSIITTQQAVIKSKEGCLQNVIDNIALQNRVIKQSEETRKSLALELKNARDHFKQCLGDLSIAEQAYNSAKNNLIYYTFESGREQLKRDKLPPEIAADAVLSTLSRVKDSSRKFYSDVFEETNMGVLTISEKGSKEVPLKIENFKLVYISESSTSDDIEIGAIFGVKMGSLPVEKVGGVQSSGSRMQAASLPPAKGSLAVDAVPKDADVKIMNIKEKYQRGMELDPGSYHVRVVAPGYDTQNLWIEVGQGEDKTIAVSLEKSRGAQIGSLPPEPGSPEPGRKIWTEPITGMQFVWVPGGCFQMGQTQEEKDYLIKDAGQETYDKYYKDELPRHPVCVDGFWVGRTEVTLGQFRKFVKARRYKTDAEKKGNAWILNKSTGWQWKETAGHNWMDPGFNQTDTHPVVTVSWNDAKAFAGWLSQRSGRTITLPTEAQWEYAARAGTTSMRFWGDNNACLYVNAADQTAFPGDSGQKWSKRFECNDDYFFTAPVGSFRPNAFGLYDMLGNVWEWCEDVYDKNAYDKHLRNNPVITSGSSRRVDRGGSWGPLPQVRSGGLPVQALG